MYSTLLEIISFPNELPKSLEQLNNFKDKAIELLNEAKIDQTVINDINKREINWGDRLSGGQSKIVQIISSIIDNPEILILDEIFVGLDKESIKTLQSMLLKHLPKAMMVIVEHQGVDNNYQYAGNRFYTDHLVLANQNLIEKKT